MTLKDDIKNTQEELRRLKEEYKSLCDTIKNTFFDRKDFFDKESPLVLKDEENTMKVAYCLSERQCYYQSRYGLNSRRPYKNWETKERGNIFIVGEDRDPFSHSQSEGKTLVRLKHIKELKEICMKIWIKEVGASYSPNTTLGFDDWLEKTSNEEILKLMKDIDHEKVILINDPSMKVRNIVVIHPYFLKF